VTVNHIAFDVSGIINSESIQDILFDLD
jgi:hypothetical protein